MYLVATKILLTNYGVVYVGQHEAEKDVQQIFEKVIYFYLHSRTADIDASNYLTYITSEKFGIGNWNGTAVNFISHWQEQVREYNNLMENEEDQLSNNLKHTMLKTAVFGTQELRSVQNMAD